MRFLPPAFALALLCAALPCQNHTVSPLSATAAEANASNTIPWWSQTHRYQQIHNDVRGNTWLIQAIALRRDGDGPSSSAVARTVDAEVFAGHGSYAAATPAFANNYTSAPVRVVNRKNVNLPDFTASQGSPAPWGLVIPFDTPFPYSGQQDLVWEVLIHSTTATGNYYCDAHSGVVASADTSLGLGCVATGKVGPMFLTPTIVSTIDLLQIQWRAANGPDNATAFVLAGGSDPNLSVTGLCTNLRAPPHFVFAGTTTRGTLVIPPFTVPFDPSLAGASIHSQAFAVDPGQSGLPLVGTQGVRSAIATPPPARVTRIWVNDVLATAGNRSEFQPYGLVVRFTHQ